MLNSKNKIPEFSLIRGKLSHDRIPFKAGLFILLLVIGLFAPTVGMAKYAAIVIHSDTGKILHGTNVDTRNYPASLTKMMTLFMVFEALKAGKWELTTHLKVSHRAARQPASRLGLRVGQTIQVEDAILALITKSANDVAVVVAENMHKTERNFALSMTAKARQIGMKRTIFRNASGLPHRGQLSTARDMARLAQILIQRHQIYYHYFSRSYFSYNGKKYRNHNKMLTTYDGVDGIKTGYIRASGFNLVASAKRRDTRLIGVIFGGKSSTHRNKLMTLFLNKGFRINDGLTSKVRIAQSDSPRPSNKNSKVKPTLEPNNNISTLHWAVQVGAYKRYAQARKSAKVAINLAPQYLRRGLIRIVPLKSRRGRTLYRSRIYGLKKRTAFAACRALEKKNRPCLELRNNKGTQLAWASDPLINTQPSPVYQTK